MTRRLAIALTFLAAAGVSGCQRSDTNSAPAAANISDAAAAKDDVKRVEMGMLDAFHAKDANRLASYYAADAVSAVPGEAMRGPDAIAKGNAAAFKDPAFKLDFSNDRTEVASSGDLAYTSGTYTLAYADAKSKAIVNDTGRYLTVFKKQSDNSWKAVADFATSTKH